MKDKKEFVYLVGDNGQEHNNVISIHKTYQGALKAWNNRRLELLSSAKNGLKYTIYDAKKRLKDKCWESKEKLSKENINYFKKIAKYGDEMYLDIIKALSEKDPNKIDNSCYEKPYIYKEEVIS